MKIKNRLQEVMWLKSITQEELSKLTGIKQSYLSEIVTGQRNVQITTAQKFAKALGKSMDYLWPY
jgi:transcriptional regulator with XRE-family HTH domain